MSKYKHVLVALELDPETDKHLINKAKEVVNQYGADLTLVHAVEHLSNYGAAYGVSVGIDIEEELLREAQRVMVEMADHAKIDQDRQVVAIGPAKKLILEEAKTRQADLIIVGSHGRHGMRLLLGSTANAVLHGAECDVLAVRVQD